MAGTNEQENRTWSGIARVIAPDGAVVIEVAAELWAHHERGRGGQWGGHLVAPAQLETPHLPDAEDRYTLRLIGAGEGTVTTHGPVKMHLFENTEPTEEVEILGIGEAPF